MSVLACLQTPIQVEQIKYHIALATYRAIRRLSAFRSIQKMLLEIVEGEQSPESLKILIFWFNSFQFKSVEFTHYADDVKGCGIYFEQMLRESFCNSLIIIAQQLAKADNPSLASAIIQGFNCRFRAEDFQLLSENIRIFPLLFRG